MSACLSNWSYMKSAKYIIKHTMLHGAKGLQFLYTKDLGEIQLRSPQTAKYTWGR